MIHPRGTRVLRVALSGLLTALVLAGPAIATAADDEPAAGPFIAIRGVDSTGGDVVRLTVAYEGEEADLAGAVITDNDSERALVGDAVPLISTGATQAVVIAIDTSEAIDPVMSDLRDAATALVEGLPDTTQIGIATFSDTFVPIRSITADRERVFTAIDELQANGESVLWNGLAGAAGTLEEDVPESQPTVVAITASGNFASVADPGTAVGALRNAGAPLYVVGLDGGRLDAGGLTDVVERAGGRLLTTTDSEQLDELAATTATDIAQQYVIAYDPPTGDDAGAVADVSIQIGDSQTAATFVRGSETSAPADLFAQEGSAPADGLLQSDMAKYIGVVLILFAAGLGAFAMIQLTQEDDSHLTNVLQPYSEGFIDNPVEDEDNGMAKTALIQRAVEMTEEFAERKGFLRGVEEKLERADMPLRAAEALFFYGAMVGVVALLALVMTGSLIGMLVFTGLAALIPSAFVNFKAKRRLKKFNAQLPDMLQLLSGTLRAGYSLMQGVEAVSREVEDPIGYELRRVVTESRLGRPLEESLDAAADRMGSADFRWAVMAIGIQREVGGNLAELLMTVADTMTARERLRRDVDALTAEGKVSAMVLGFLPVGLAGAMYVINPEYIGVLFSERIGHMMLGGATMLALFGFWWMKKLIEIDV
jgi:tight adherence protein B